MNEDDLIRLLNYIQRVMGDDKEMVHVKADRALIEFLYSNGHEKAAKVYEKMSENF